ncbi:unnamed protein product [Closterium sp. Naga37s-1]|nr:unnamed protein product [Closterium sp. Naga37s-1]
MLKPEELKANFEEEAPASAREPARYARNFLEYCCFRALAVATQVTEHLKDKDFRRWTFDMMLAWEAPGASNQPTGQMDVESSVCMDAFARLAPAIPLVADSVTVHALFELLTDECQGGRLPFAIYNNYLSELEKTVKTIKNSTTGALASALGIVRGEEAVIETDGQATQPVLQHIGVSAWPGRLTLTDCALYFEPSGVVSYDAAKKFDLAADLHQTVKPDLTGPWGAKLFDKAIMYKSHAITEPVVLEFPELTAHMRRDYWLSIIREIIAVHSFVRTYKLEGPTRRQAIAKAVRGIARLKAVWSLQKALPTAPESLLTFIAADELPGGDKILRAMAGVLKADSGSPKKEREQLEKLGEFAAAAVRNAGFGSGGGGGGGTAGEVGGGAAAGGAAAGGVSSRWQQGGSAAAAAVAAFLPGTAGLMGGGGAGALGVGSCPSMPVGDVLVGEMTALERAVKNSRDKSSKVAKAKRSVEEVKVEGIGTNVALMKELLVPAMLLGQWFQSLASWEEPIKTMVFLAFALYIIYKDWLGYVIPFLLLTNAVIMMWLRFVQQSDRRRPPNRRNEVVVITPPNQSAVEQLVVLQAALAQVEAAIQALNIALLKARALALLELPTATDELIAVHIFLAILLTPPCVICPPCFFSRYPLQVEAAIQALNIALLKARALALSELPTATDELIAVHVVLAILLAILPVRVVVLLVLGDVFTREMDSTLPYTVLPSASRLCAASPLPYVQRPRFPTHISRPLSLRAVSPFPYVQFPPFPTCSFPLSLRAVSPFPYVQFPPFPTCSFPLSLRAVSPFPCGQLPHAPCPMPHAQCPMFTCHMPHALFASSPLPFIPPSFGSPFTPSTFFTTPPLPHTSTLPTSLSYPPFPLPALCARLVCAARRPHFPCAPPLFSLPVQSTSVPPF